MPMRIEQKGFTLLEVLVALAVMAIAVTMVAQLFSANLRSVAASVDTAQALVRAEARIREIISNDSMTEKVWNETADDGYRYNVSVSEILKDRTDNLNVKLMEINLTIYWTAGLKEKKFNLRTVKMVEKAAETDTQGAL